MVRSAASRVSNHEAPTQPSGLILRDACLGRLLWMRVRCSKLLRDRREHSQQGGAIVRPDQLVQPRLMPGDQLLRPRQYRPPLVGEHEHVRAPVVAGTHTTAEAATFEAIE